MTAFNKAWVVVKNLTRRPLDNTTFRPFVGDPYELGCVKCDAPATFAVDCKKHPLDPRQMYEGVFCADCVDEAVCGECAEEGA